MRIMAAKKIVLWGTAVAMLLAPANGQLSVVMALAGGDVRTFVNLFLERDDVDWSQYESINMIANVFSIIRGEDNDFKGTVFLPLDETIEELEGSPVYARIFENEAFVGHLQLLLFNHLVPGGELDLSDLEEDSDLQLETAAGEILDANSIIPSIVESDINSFDVMGHIIDKLLLPSFWDTSVQDVVGNPDLSDDEVYTVYLPPILEVAECSTFWESHVVVGDVIREPAVEVIETVYANNGIVHRMAQSFPYDSCPTEAPTSSPTTSPTIAPTGSPTESPTKAPTDVSLPVLPTSGNDSPAASPTSTEQPTSEDKTLDDDDDINDEVDQNNSGITNSSQDNTTEEINYIPIIAGVSVASCLIAIGCVFGLLFFGQRGGKGEKPKPQRESSGLPDNFFDAPTVCPEPAQTQGYTLDPSVQEPSLLTLPTFLDNNNNNRYGAEHQ